MESAGKGEVYPQRVWRRLPAALNMAPQSGRAPMERLAWGIAGPGSIANNFADGLAQSDSGRLVAIASRDAARRAAFGDKYGVARRHADYAALFADPEVQAVYIATPHPWHAELGLAAIRAGKPVLIEKPAGMNAAEVTMLAEAARQEGVFFMEAFMYRCHPQIARVLEVIASGEIGKVVHVRTAFGFSAGFDPASRLYDKALGGGGILDVGGYPVSLARLIAGAASGQRFADPVAVKGAGRLGPSGVDEVAYGILTFGNGVTAEIAAAVARAMDNSCTITGTNGWIRILDPWVPGRNEGPSDATLEITAGGAMRTEVLRDPRMLFAFEAELVSRAILDGALEAPAPAPNWADSIGNNTTLDRWRAELGYVTFAETPATNRRLAGTLPKGLPAMKRVALPGLKRPLSALILGCDNKNDIASAAVVWDAFAEAGGTSFDTGFVYGNGLHETVLGQWLKARGVASEMNVIVKGAHTPYNLPQAVGPQLAISLERLGLDHAPVYILHRDNPAIPAGEFVAALNEQAKAGRIGIFGGSNWSPARIAEANDWAAKNGMQGFSLLNNNLSLAVMERPVWPGCVTSNDAATLAFLRQSGLAHLSWSSQARGYFLPAELRDRLPEDTRPETCFGSPANAERRARAEALAAEKGTTANAIAGAWVLAQDFPSLALIGPRTAGELASTLSALAVTLTAAERDWLNLERADR
jgi:predicted dehydrogenase/aryl-alcohol dehydrogenase-like predicted oxidoreductase